MVIYLVRHAIAVPHGAPGVAESDRPLTPQGIRKMRRIVRGLRRLGVELDEIWTSPLPRARQTAELLAKGIAFKKEIRDVDDLRPEADLRLMSKELAKAGAKKRIALVGHEPALGQLATWLLSGLKSSVVQFKKGGAACIQAEQVDPPSGNQLLWLLTPKQLTSIARAKA